MGTDPTRQPTLIQQIFLFTFLQNLSVLHAAKRSLKLQSQATPPLTTIQYHNYCKESLNTMPTFPIARDDDNAEEPAIRSLLFDKTPLSRQPQTLRDEQPLSEADRQTESDPRSEDDAEVRRQREEQESIELAQQLMAEEAMASYHHAFGMLQQSRDNLSDEDYEALQAALQEDEREEIEELEDDEGELSYETMLQLGERIGDVKTERWALKARQVIDRLPSFCFQASSEPPAQDADDSEIKCLVCQCEYEGGDKLRRLPCSHCFHAECADQWLLEKDICPYCRQTIVPEN